MNRKQAEALVGARVQAWTSANGVYVGTLVRLTDDRPWRGVVLIDGVLEPALAWDKTRSSPRRGFRPGEEIEVGGASIKETAEQGTSYFDALERDLQKLRELAATAGRRDEGWLQRSIPVREQQIAAERDLAN